MAPNKKSAFYHPITLALCCCLLLSCDSGERSVSAVSLKQRAVLAETGIIAEVNGNLIEASEFNRLFKWHDVTDKHTQTERRLDKVLAVKQRVAAELIDRELLEQAARQKGIDIDADDVDAAVEDYVKDTFPSLELYRKYLQQMPGGEEKLRYVVRSRLLKEKLAGIGRNAEVDEQAARDFYEKNIGLYKKARNFTIQEILVSLPGKVLPEERQRLRNKAVAIAAKIQGRSQDFTLFVRQYSDSDEDYRGGLIKANVELALWQAIDRLKPGQVSPVVETKQGFHIVKLISRNPAQNKSFDEVRQQIQTALKMRKYAHAMNELLVDLRQSAEIVNYLQKRYMPLLASLRQENSSLYNKMWASDHTLVEGPLTKLGDLAVEVQQPIIRKRDHLMGGEGLVDGEE